MTLKEFLKATNVDIDTNKSVLANQLKAELTRQEYHIDYSQDINNLSDEDLYQLGRALLMPDFTGIPFSNMDLVLKMKEEIKNKLTELKNNCA